jgi:hypothetical protein
MTGNEFVFITDQLALYILYAGVLFSIFMLALISTTAMFTNWRAPITVIFFITAAAISYTALGELLGRPKPVDIMTWDKPDVKEARVLAQFHVPKKAIYLLLMYKGLTAPRYYQFPWSEEASRELKKAKEGVKAEAIQGISLKNPFKKAAVSGMDKRKFPEVHEIPWPMSPPKEMPAIEFQDLNTIDS